MFHLSFIYFIFGKSLSEVQFYALKLDTFTFYACNKMYIRASVAVLNHIKITYFSKIDFERNLFNVNCANLLSTASSLMTKMIRNNKDLKKKVIMHRNKATVISKFFTNFFCDFEIKSQ